MAEQSYQRATAVYEPRYDRFILHSKNYIQQYNQIFLNRMKISRPHIIRRATQKWPTARLLDSIIDIENFRDDEGEVVIVGVLIKDLCMRKSILDDYREGGKASSSFNPLSALASDRDRMILEDFSGRVALAGAIVPQISQLVSGVVVAVKGRISTAGDFSVSDVTYSFDVEDADEPSDMRPSIMTLPPAQLPARMVMLVSGLGLGAAASPVHDLAVQLLVDFVCGRMTDAKSAEVASRVARVVICGDSVEASDLQELKERFSGSKGKAALSTPSKQLDVFVAQLLSSSFVDVMPGQMDPANIALPQQPLHPCLFQHSARFSTFERVTNPYEFALNGVVITGHSGQPVQDIARQSFEPGKEQIAAPDDDEMHVQIDSTEESADPAMEIDEVAVASDNKPQRVCGNLEDPARRLLILKRTLQWGHLAPSFPDTAPCYPFADSDPFIIHGENMPKILFAGNQPGFATQLVTVSDGAEDARIVRLVCVPSFRTTGTVVLCDIQNPQVPCYSITFR